MINSSSYSSYSSCSLPRLMHFFRAPPRDPEPNQSPPNLDTATTIRSLHHFCLLPFLVRLIKSFKESLAAATAASLSFSLSLPTICRLSRFFAALLPRLQFFVARARTRGCFPTLCVLLSPVPRRTRCEKGKPLNLCGNDTRLNWCENKTRLSTCMKRTKGLRVFKRHASQSV